MKKLLIIAPCSSLFSRPRLAKVVKIAYLQKFEISFWGWNRDNVSIDEKDLEGFISNKKIILNNQKFYIAKKISYMIWIFLIFFKLIRKNNSGIIYSMGFETTLPIYIASKFKKIKFIFDDPDRFTKVHYFPKILRKRIEIIEQKISNASFFHIIPGLDRYDFFNKNQIVVKNFPSREDIKLANRKNMEKKSKCLSIYINGWLVDTRGIPIIYEVAKKLMNNETINFIVAGRLGGKFSKKLVKLNNVKYFGKVSHVKALSLYRISDLVFTFYDPNYEINLYAESNKWGDAICMRVPILVNNKVKTAKYLRDNDVCFSFDYNDIDSIVELLLKIVKDKSLLKDKIANLNKLFNEVSYFDDQMEKVFIK